MRRSGKYRQRQGEILAASPKKVQDQKQVSRSLVLFFKLFSQINFEREKKIQADSPKK